MEVPGAESVLCSCVSPVAGACVVPPKGLAPEEAGALPEGCVGCETGCAGSAAGVWVEAEEAGAFAALRNVS